MSSPCHCSWKAKLDDSLVVVLLRDGFEGREILASISVLITLLRSDQPIEL